jgi:DNA repair exonuclease SbcCD ATPase subunit
VAKKEVSIWVRAKNGLAGGLASATDSLRNFTSKARSLVSTMLGPLAVATAVVVGLKQAFELVGSAITSAQRRLAEMSLERAEGALEATRKAVARLDAAYSRATQAAKFAGDEMKATADAARAVADMQRELSRRRELGEAGGDAEAADAINARYDAEKRAEEAKRKTLDVAREIADMEATATRREEQARKLAERRAQLESRILGLRTQAAELSGRGATFAANLPGAKWAEELRAQADRATKIADDSKKEAEALTRKIADLEATAAHEREMAAAKRGEMTAAELGEELAAIQTKNAAEEKAHARRMKRLEEYNKATEEFRRAEQAMQDAAQREEERGFREQARRADELMAKSGRLAQMRVRDIMRESRERASAEKKQERRDKLDDARARRLTLRSRETDIFGRAAGLRGQDRAWLEAFNQRREVRDAAEQKQVADENLRQREMQRQTAVLEGIAQQLKQTEAMMRELMPVG